MTQRSQAFQFLGGRNLNLKKKVFSTGHPERSVSLRSKFSFLNLAHQSRTILSAMAPSSYTTQMLLLRP